MIILNKLLYKCFYKLETLESIVEQLHIGDHVKYINGKNKVTFLITNIHPQSKEITATTFFKQGHAIPNSIGIYDCKSVHKYIDNTSIFKSVFVEDEIYTAGVHYEYGEECYTYKIFKATVVIPFKVQGFLINSKLKNSTSFVLFYQPVNKN